jgi:RNA polymerase sigma-70 factor, ECF subfamily
MSEAQKKFGQIYDDNVDKIYRFILVKVGSKEIAEDLTAETFTKVWKVFEKRHNKNNPLSQPESFCYKTARNLVIDHYRKKGRQQTVSMESLPLASKENLENQITIDSDVEMVMRAIKDIKSDYQDVIVWHYLDELSVSEMAQIMGKSEGATRVMVHRALESLKNVLES